ncbi:hypothetical protein [Loigolactobacillus backii]|uniref:hypothetical protein n=1 Tax=Loigolactobacillus backii TaxID=375175 RepID=UPI0007F0FCC4|nr:hypothetical protein [Loigolactobacillus backii]ANK59833.1 hypothetical protein AYR52_05900 [Loigolactobacillus backii]
MSNNEKHTFGGIGFIGLLTIVFITLKLTHVINWSWRGVLSPIWIGFFTSLAIMAIVLFIMWIKGDKL